MATESLVFHGIVGRSRQMRRVVRNIREIAPLDIPVLIYGESGAGKELVARAIHEESPRRHGPFCAVNAGAIPSALVASELFGHEKGAFTGATAARQGFFAAATGGTLFLDEIATMKHDMQVSLLRVLETRRYTRVGGSSESVADVRVIAATNSNLTAQHNAGTADKGSSGGANLDNTFRRDLYFRLSVYTIDIPPLRQRQADIPLLIHHLLARLSEEFDKEVTGFDKIAVRKLCAYGWPGNVRELLNVVTRLVVGARGTTISEEEVVDALHDVVGDVPGSGSTPHRQRVDSGSEDAGLTRESDSSARRSGGRSHVGGLPAEKRAEEDDLPPCRHDARTAPHGTNEGTAAESETAVIRAGETIEDAERELIRLTLTHARGNRTRAAKLLGISRKSLYNKMKVYGIDP